MDSLTYLQLLRRNRSFRRLWWGQVISELGNWFNFIAGLGLVRMVSNGDPEVTTIMLLARMVPFTVFAPLAGALVDRWSRRMVMIVSDFARVAIALGFLLVSVTFPGSSRAGSRVWRARYSVDAAGSGQLRGRVLTTDRASELLVWSLSTAVAGWSLRGITPRTLTIISGLLSSVSGVVWLLLFDSGKIRLPDKINSSAPRKKEEISGGPEDKERPRLETRPGFRS